MFMLNRNLSARMNKQDACQNMVRLEIKAHDEIRGHIKIKRTKKSRLVIN